MYKYITIPNKNNTTRKLHEISRYSYQFFYNNKINFLSIIGGFLAIINAVVNFYYIQFYFILQDVAMAQNTFDAQVFINDTLQVNYPKFYMGPPVYICKC